MNRDDVIRMAREAGFREPNPHDGCMGLAYDYRDGTDTGASLERFAALVAAAERAEVERLKLLCEEMLRELYVYRASEYLKDVTAAIRAKGETK